MVYLHNSISVCNPVDQAMSSNSSRTTTRKLNASSSPTTCSSFPVCEGSHSAAIDVFILIAVITSCAFLFFPYLKLITLASIDVFSDISVLVKAEILQNPIVYGSLALSVFCAAISAWLVVLLCTMHRCGKPNCKGLRKAVEFDIQIETEDCIKSSSSNSGSGGKKGRVELPRVHHRELEAELKKMAPPNGRAVLVFRARCGCSVRRLVVSGPKKQQRKVKK
ncbi:Ribosomal protein L34e superfamily protein [Hirschfeldia incana]|nr:Ribosomal protein L34e superfamily protein [Hirschfeldia incana]